MEMLLTGDMIAAEDAQRIGLINRVVPAGDERRARARAGAQDRGEVDAHGQDRQAGLLPPARTRLSPTPISYTIEVMVENMLARDAEEGIGAFIEKREPKWEDR